MTADRFRFGGCAAFTLLEVMIALAVLGIAMFALLGLHHQNLQSVIRAHEVTQASMLAQDVLTQAELERFPLPGKTSGDFHALLSGKYPQYRWERTVTNSGLFPDLRQVTVTVLYGPGFARRFSLTEVLHNPAGFPPPNRNQGQGALGQNPSVGQGSAPIGMPIGPGQQ
ncbi:MAG: type IV pilus modification PilV family protein [Candidatus Binataceae bacterium]